MAAKIQELESKVSDSRQRSEEDRLTFDEEMKQGGQTRADVELEMETLEATKKTIQIDLGMTRENNDIALRA